MVCLVRQCSGCDALAGGRSGSGSDRGSTTSIDNAQSDSVSTSTVLSVDGFEVTSTVVSHPSTRSITIWSPVDDGNWPVFFGYHGLGGDTHQMGRLASEVAKTGAVVIVPTYRSTQREYRLADTECAYRYGRSIVEEYGGDPTRQLRCSATLLVDRWRCGSVSTTLPLDPGVTTWTASRV